MPRRSHCKVCTIKLIRKKGRPKDVAMPCNIADCPYEIETTLSAINKAKYDALKEDKISVYNLLAKKIKKFETDFKNVSQ